MKRYYVYNLGLGANLNRLMASFASLPVAKKWLKFHYDKRPFSYGIFDILQGRFI